MKFKRIDKKKHHKNRQLHKRSRCMLTIVALSNVVRFFFEQNQMCFTQEVFDEFDN